MKEKELHCMSGFMLSNKKQILIWQGETNIRKGHCKQIGVPGERELGIAFLT